MDGIAQFVHVELLVLVPFVGDDATSRLTGADFILARNVGKGAEAGAVAPDAEHVLLCGAD